jgi:signal transduction histidine kinase/ActR/RegA family two-component response regulator
MGSLNGQMLSEGLLEALVAVAEQGLSAPSAGLRIRQSGAVLGVILERGVDDGDPPRGGVDAAPGDGLAYGRLASQILEHLAPGGRLLDATPDRVTVCLPTTEIADRPSSRQQLVMAVLGSIAGRQFGRATVRPELRLIDGDTAWVLTIRLGGSASALADPLVDVYDATDEVGGEPGEVGGPSAEPWDRASIERQERMRLLGEMAAGVAHGLNNLLGAVAGQSSELLGESPAAPPASGLRLIHQAALDGAGLARRLLRFSRGESSATDDSLELADVREIVQDAVALTRPRWHDLAVTRDAAIDVQVEMAQPMPVMAISSDLREIVVNLILNAVDAMPSGGRLHLRGEVQDRWAILTVQDTGAGMDLAVMEQAFEPFFSTKGNAGTGMGLAIVYSVVARHGGEVRVASAIGVGTTLTVILPLADPALFGATDRGRAAEDDASAELDGLALLLVDDDPAFRDVFARRLALDAERVDVADDAAGALQALATGSWDVLCIDERLPDMTGRTLASEIRRRGYEAIIVLVSGFATQPNDPTLLGPGVDAVLPKPCTDAELARVLRQIRPGRAEGVSE